MIANSRIRIGALVVLALVAAPPLASAGDWTIVRFDRSITLASPAQEQYTAYFVSDFNDIRVSMSCPASVVTLVVAGLTGNSVAGYCAYGSTADVTTEYVSHGTYAIEFTAVGSGRVQVSVVGNDY